MVQHQPYVISIRCFCLFTLLQYRTSVAALVTLWLRLLALNFRYKAVYNYKPQNSDELELREGDIVQVVEKCDDGWFVGMWFISLYIYKCYFECIILCIVETRHWSKALYKNGWNKKKKEKECFGFGRQLECISLFMYSQCNTCQTSQASTILFVTRKQKHILLIQVCHLTCHPYLDCLGITTDMSTVLKCT